MANENMIQKHLDNFLAKIAGEVPADENVRTSQEFWLNEIAKYAGGNSTDDASTKKIYCHPIQIGHVDSTPYFIMTCLIFNNDPTPFTLGSFKTWLDNIVLLSGESAVVMASGYYKSTDAEITSMSYIYKSKTTGNYGIAGGKYNTSTLQSVSNASFDAVFPSGTTLNDGVNAIN